MTPATLAQLDDRPARPGKAEAACLRQGLRKGRTAAAPPGSPAHYRFDVIVITSAWRGSLSDLVRSGQHASVTRIGVKHRRARGPTDCCNDD